VYNDRGSDRVRVSNRVRITKGSAKGVGCGRDGPTAGAVTMAATRAVAGTGIVVGAAVRKVTEAGTVGGDYGRNRIISGARDVYGRRRSGYTT
jgi:hypothetical protein